MCQKLPSKQLLLKLLVRTAAALAKEALMCVACLQLGLLLCLNIELLILNLLLIHVKAVRRNLRYKVQAN